QAPVFTRDGHRIAAMGGATLAVGAHTVTARYEGDDAHLPSESVALLQEIAQGDYFALDLTPGITSRVTVTGVNGAGQVIGAAPLFLGGQLSGYVGLLYDHGLHFLPLLGGTSTVPFDLNDTGTIVGLATVASGATHAFLDKDAHITDLGTLDGG